MTLNEEYNNLCIKRDLVKEQKELLEKTKPVQDYLNIKTTEEELVKKAKQLNEKILFQRISTCLHRTITLKDSKVRACIKCGLSEEVWNNRANDEDDIMYDYLRRFERYVIGEHTGITCDLNQAMEIYSLIRDENKGASEDQVVSEFIKTMNNIQKDEKQRTLRKTLNEPRSIWDWPL